MAINFPSSPTDGQIFDSGTVRYTYSIATGAWSAAPLSTALPFNYIVNPIMDISQQNGNTQYNVATSGSYFPADQWYVSGSAAGVTWSMGRHQLPHGEAYEPSFGSAIWMYSNVAKPSLGAGEYFHIYQWLEGQRVAQFQWGLANAKPAVVRFWCMAPAAGYYAFTLMNASQTRSFTGPFLADNYWKEFIIPIPPTITGTWPTTAASGMLISWSGMWGSNFVRAGSWGWGDDAKYAGPDMTNCFAFAPGFFRLAQVGLYLDPLNTGKAPPWQAVSEHQAMVDCCRYWYRMENARGVTTGATGFNRVGAAHPVTMRTGPAYALVSPVTIHDIGTNNAMTAVGSGYPSLWHAEIETTGSGLTAGRAGLMLTDNAAGYVAVNARM